MLVLLHNEPDSLVKTNDPAWRPSVRFGLGLSVLFSLSCFSVLVLLHNKSDPLVKTNDPARCSFFRFGVGALSL